MADDDQYVDENRTGDGRINETSSRRVRLKLIAERRNDQTQAEYGENLRKLVNWC